MVTNGKNCCLKKLKKNMNFKNKKNIEGGVSAYLYSLVGISIVGSGAVASNIFQSW
jgi:hypothetical protein